MAVWLWNFWIFSFWGWCLERLFAAVTHSPRQRRRCLLVSPLCPVYGLGMAAVLALAAVFLVFSALMNLFLGLKMPNLHWTSEITPIKQSGAVALALLGGWAYAAAMAALYFWVGRHMGFAAYMGAFLALTLAAAVLLYIWVRKKGCAIFASL